jgi:outer membrane protein assembly factor BamE (lipoprotein component of BamABCDE complex)
MKNLIIISLAALTTLSCALKDNIKLSGIANLVEKEKILKINKTNKNDVIKLLGSSVFLDYTKENTWVYGETIIKRKWYGSNKILKSTILYLDFNNRGVLIDKEILDKKEVQNIDFSKANTLSKSLNTSFSKKFFSSMRKRYKKNKINTE